MRDRLNINISVARACFVRCDGCYNHFGRPGRILTTEEIVAFLSYARARGVSKVTLCGGDPLARPDILSLLWKVKSLGYSMNLDTVGTPLLGAASTLFFGRGSVEQVDAQQLASLVDLIGIPIDGASNETVASFRAGRPDLLDEQLRVVETLSAQDAALCINTVVHRANMGDIPSILNLIGRYPSVVRWQLFQFTPSGPLAYHNRATYAVADQTFSEVAARIQRLVRESGFHSDVEFKSNADRKGDYLLVDPNGLAWVPKTSSSNDWNPAADANDQRVILGNITEVHDHEAILDAVLDPAHVLPPFVAEAPTPTRPTRAVAAGGRKRSTGRSTRRGKYRDGRSSSAVQASLRPLPDTSRPEMTGAAAVAAMLRMHGVRTVFAYPGTSELALCDAVAATGMGLASSRGDKEAVFMAAGGNLLRPNSCVAVLHGARGLTNALGAVADTRRSETAVLCLVGMASRASATYLPPHAEPDLMGAARAYARSVFDCSHVEGFDAPAYIRTVRDAIVATTNPPHGPILLGIPQDLLSTAFVPSALVVPAPAKHPPVPVSDIDAASQLLAAATQPVILVDDYLLQAGPHAERLLGEVATAAGAPVFQIAYRRGPMLFQRAQRELVPTFLGYYEPTQPAHRDLLDAADLVVTVEDRNMYPRVVGPLPACRKAAITSNPSATRKNGYLSRTDVLVAGDVTHTLHRLAEVLRVCETTSTADSWTYRWHPPGSPSSQAAVALVRGIAGGLAAADPPLLVDDSQMLGGLVSRNYGLLPPNIRIFGSHGGFVGSGLATAVGLAMADPRQPVLCLLGDQGFTNGAQGLAAAGENDAPVVIVVCNNGSSVSLRTQANADGLEIGTAGSSPLTNNPRMSYTAVARAYGVRSSVLEWPQESVRTAAVTKAADTFARTVADAIAARRPYLLELVVPGTAEFWAGVWNTAGYDEPRRSAVAADQTTTPTHGLAR